MARSPCDLRILLLAAAAAFIYIQVRLFSTQSHYADRLAQAVKMKIRQDEERVHLKILIQDLEKRSVQTLVNNNVAPVAAVVVMACNRPDYLQRTVESILKYQTSVASKFPLFISQDGINGEVKKKALSYNEITYMQGNSKSNGYKLSSEKQGHNHTPNLWMYCLKGKLDATHLDLEPVRTERPGELIAYYKIAKHYKWALDELFIKHNFARVIILEDDMEIAPDFFDYFEAAAKLLDNDKTIMAVSSWNDNGQKQFVYDPNFTYWDDWVRLKEVHRDRQFIRPEVCRTYNFGEHGSSMGQFFRQYLEPIKLNDAHIKWNSEDLSYLKEDKFLIQFGKDVASATPLHGSDAALKAHNMDADVRIQYNDQEDFERIARQFGIFEEWKDGIPRTAYKGVVVFRYKSSRRRIYLVGPDSLSQLRFLNWTYARMKGNEILIDI
uniref:Alpha-1,3-mannosyl-glycoprotein 2-beta-N-acetylglucosaminyltransferase n=1 Tax=Oryza barthii TaxID=65489 RepID=A0A0D3FCH8_9ORYZ